jgi:hypothetical protein
MQATGFFAIAVVIGFLMLVVFGAAWFIAVPLAFLFFLVPVAFAAALAGRGRDRGQPPGGEGVPSSAEASYDPVADPAQRPRTR